jgi:hypothetical protein
MRGLCPVCGRSISLLKGGALRMHGSMRGLCPVCGRSISLLKGGALRMHGREKDTGSRWASCSGSGLLPSKEAA